MGKVGEEKELATIYRNDVVQAGTCLTGRPQKMARAIDVPNRSIH